MIYNPWDSFLNNEDIGNYKLGMLYSESFSGIPYERDINMPFSVGRNDETIINYAIGIDKNNKPIFRKVSGGLQKTLRIAVLLHETSHFVHDMSLGSCMEIDYLSDSGLSALIHILHTLPDNKQILCPFFDRHTLNKLYSYKELIAPLDFLQERESLAITLYSKPPELAEYACSLNPIFKKFSKEINDISGLALMEGLVAVKTLFAMFLRIKDEDDAVYLENIKNEIPLLPEKLSKKYNIARRIYDLTIGERLLISDKYSDDAWPHSYPNTMRAISDEGFLYITDMALHIPPFEYNQSLIEKGLNTWDDFIPTKRFFNIINTLLKKGHFPPQDSKYSVNQFYRTVFDFIASDLGWPTFETTNYIWTEKLKKYKELRQEATDGYRHRLVCEKHNNPSDIVVSDCIEACMKQFIPIIHLTPNVLKIISGIVIGERHYYTPIEFPDMAPFYIMNKNIPLWKDLPPNATLEDLATEANNKLLFQQEIVYRIICISLKNAILYSNYYNCPFSKNGCSISLNSCQHISNLDKIPKENCCVSSYASFKGIDTSKINWS